MEGKTILYDKSHFIVTKKNAKISKKAIIKGLKHIRVGGGCIVHGKVTIRGDMEDVSLGSYVMVQEGVLLKPTIARESKKIKH